MIVFTEWSQTYIIDFTVFMILVYFYLCFVYTYSFLSFFVSCFLDLVSIMVLQFAVFLVSLKTRVSSLIRVNIMNKINLINSLWNHFFHLVFFYSWTKNLNFSSRFWRKRIHFRWCSVSNIPWMILHGWSGSKGSGYQNSQTNLNRNHSLFC